jgi:hypothetical protein
MTSTERQRTTFKLAASATTEIEAPVARVWALLTDADDYPRWNSTVSKIEGRIAPGEKLRLRVPGTARVFSPRVSVFVPERRMVWRGGFLPLFEGIRVFELEAHGGTRTRFTLGETFRGLILPLVAGQMPDFVPIFERFAADLKLAAESVNMTMSEIRQPCRAFHSISEPQDKETRHGIGS